MTNTIDSIEFSEVIGEKLTDITKGKLEGYNFSYSNLTKEEHEEAIDQIKEAIKKPPAISGKHRAEDWERGWGENKQKYRSTRDIKETIPRYFSKFPYVRWNNELIKPSTMTFEYEILCLLEYQIFSKWLKDYDNIYEFGCGTGHNLLRLREVNSQCKLFGLDWSKSSQELIGYINEDTDLDCEASQFDFFNPNYDYDIETNSAIYTVAALEQVGESFECFIDFLLHKKPNLCINIEPIPELFEGSDLELDKLCVEYCKSRHYLLGYLDCLQELEKKGKIRILQCNRNYIGSFFIEGYSTIIWRIL